MYDYAKDEFIYDYFEKSAEEYYKAQIELGVCYYNGLGRSKDLDKEIFWFEKSADKDEKAQYVGIYLFRKRRTKIVKQSLYLKKAAKKEHLEAMSSLEKVIIMEKMLRKTKKKHYFI